MKIINKYIEENKKFKHSVFGTITQIQTKPPFYTSEIKHPDGYNRHSFQVQFQGEEFDSYVPLYKTMVKMIKKYRLYLKKETQSNYKVPTDVYNKIPVVGMDIYPNLTGQIYFPSIDINSTEGNIGLLVDPKGKVTDMEIY